MKLLSLGSPPPRLVWGWLNLSTGQGGSRLRASEFLLADLAIGHRRVPDNAALAGMPRGVPLGRTVCDTALLLHGPLRPLRLMLNNQEPDPNTAAALKRRRSDVKLGRRCLVEGSGVARAGPGWRQGVRNLDYPDSHFDRGDHRGFVN